MSYSNLQIEDVSFSNYSNSALFVVSSVLIVSNGSFQNSLGLNFNGLAIQSLESNVRITKSVFNNLSGNMGAAIYSI